MKKLFAMIFSAVMGFSSLFAGDVEDVKAVIVKDLESGAQGRFAEVLALRTPDFVQVSKEGSFNYEQEKWAYLALDGKHPEEFLLTMLAVESRGKMKKPTAEMMAKIREMSRDPEFVKQYEKEIGEIASAFKADQAHQLKNLNFVSVKVEGALSTAVIEADSKTPRGIKCGIATISLRKVDGAWKMCKIVVEINKIKPLPEE